jgi:hypothetical protein
MGRSRIGNDMNCRGRPHDLDHNDSDVDINVDVKMDVGGWGQWFPGDHDFGRSHWGRDDDDSGHKSKALDLEIDVDQKGKWLDVEIEIGSFEVDLKLDGRHLQPDSGPVTAVVGGEGTAIGEDTLVAADIFSRLIDLGSVTIAFGVTQFSSAAVSGDDFVFAAADTFADVSGADLVFYFSTKTTDGSVAEDGSFATEVSTTSFIAIDFEDFDFAEGQLAFYINDVSPYLDGGCAGPDGPKAPNIAGNVSTLDVDAQALAENTLVDVLTSILTIEDQLSTVSAVTISAVG